MLAVPLVAFFASTGLINRIESYWRTAIAEAYGAAAADEAPSLQLVCTDEKRLPNSNRPVLP